MKKYLMNFNTSVQMFVAVCMCLNVLIIAQMCILTSTFNAIKKTRMFN